MQLCWVTKIDTNRVTTAFFYESIIIANKFLLLGDMILFFNMPSFWDCNFLWMYLAAINGQKHFGDIFSVNIF